MPKKQDFYDATQPETPERVRDIDAEIAEAKKKADSHRQALETLTQDEILKNKKKNYVVTVIASLGSVGILLILSIVFFIFLKWYGVGVGFAVLTLIVAQVWLHFFKKWNKVEHASLDEDLQAEYELQMSLKEKRTPQPKQTNELIIKFEKSGIYTSTTLETINKLYKN